MSERGKPPGGDPTDRRRASSAKDRGRPRAGDRAAGADRSRATDRSSRAERSRTERPRTERSRTERPRTERLRTERPRTERARAADTSRGSDRSGARSARTASGSSATTGRRRSERTGSATGGRSTAGTRRPAGRPTGRPAQPRSRTTGSRGSSPRQRTYRAPRRVPLASSANRVKALMLTLGVLVSLFAGRLVQVQVFDTEAYAASASKQMTKSVPLLPVRGQITDRNGQVLAASEPAVAVTADPTLTTEEAPRIADLLVKHLGGKPSHYLPALTKPDTRYVIVAKKVPAAIYDNLAVDLAEADIYGIFRESDPIRTYPAGTVASNIVGFTGGDEGGGLSGFEFAFNKELSGTAGSEVYESAPNGSRIPLGTNVITPATDGTNYELTIDAELQWTTEQRLAEAVRKAKAESGSAIVMDVNTGEVLALANYPSFDAANPGKADADNLGNKALTHQLEPGSVQKVLTMAALADAGLATPDTRVKVPASLRSADHRITDSFSHGDIQLTARGVMAKSSNIGTVLLARQMSSTDLSRYLHDFGLGAPTGIELPGEAAGSVPRADMASYTHDQIAFGQGLSVTPMQNAAALAAVLNGGVHHRPTIISSATDSEGRPVEVPRTEPRRVISEEASAMVRDMTQAVIAEGGTGVNLNLESYTSGGKTATAQRVDPDCGCYRGYTASWVQYAPVENPELLVLVTIDKPVNGHYGGTVSGPVAQDVLNYALPRYGFLPEDDPAAPDRPLTW